MSDDAKKEEGKQDEKKTDESVQKPVKPTRTDDDINKDIEAINAEFAKQEEQWKKEIETKTAAEIAKFKEELNKSTDEKINKVINEYKDKLANVDKQLSERTSHVAQETNPFRASTSTTGVDWYKDPTISNDDKMQRLMHGLTRR